MKINLLTKLDAVEEYLKEKNLKRVAVKYNIHYATLSRWVKNLVRNDTLYYKPWNRLSEKIEQRVVLLKEKRPDLRLAQAKKILSDEGIKVSIKGIYNIWLRYGMAKRIVDDPFSFFVFETPEIKNCLEYARFLLKKDSSFKTLKKVAEIINRLPGYPKDNEDILEKIPEELLSLKRRFDKLYIQFLKIPTPEFYKKIHRLRLQMEKNSLYYSAIIAGLSEILALHWMRTPKKELELNKYLCKLKGELRDPVLNFQLSHLASSAWIELMEIDKAKRLAQKAKRLLRRLPHSSFYESYGSLMTFMSNYQSALFYHKKALENAPDEDSKNRLYFKIALDLTLMGKHHEALKYLKLAHIDYKDKYYESYNLSLSLANLGLGRIEKSLFYLQKTLEKSEKEQFRNTIFTTICCYGAIKSAMGEKKGAKEILRRYLKLIKKYQLKREVEIMENLIYYDTIFPEVSKIPTVYLLYLIKKAKNSLRLSDYQKLLKYAQKYGITGFLHRCLMFTPEPVLNMLNRGKNPELPISLLRLPVFNPATPTYQIRFLGETIIYKNQRHLRAKFTPKENAFLIFLGTKISEPEKSVSVEEIYNNFWSKVEKPENRLSHLLVSLKEKLMMPRHLLAIQLLSNGRVLINKGFYTTTDYSEFTSIIARARALERAGEWGFAKKEYLRAFKLFRGEPFKKNFDDWSVNMRFKILTEFETEAMNFAKSCIQHDEEIRHTKRRTPSAKHRGGEMADARKILQKVLKIIPDSEEAKGLLDSLIVL
ncbi:MAG: hypothetical protein ACPL28_10590 [bacterium]